MSRRAKIPLPDLSEPLIRPTSDVFTAVLWSAPKNEPLLRDFINAVQIDCRQPSILEATVLNPFNIKEFREDRQLVLDVHVQDEWSRRYNVEIQTAPHAGFGNRTVLHWSNLYSSQLRTGDDFTQLLPVQSFVITAFPIFPQLRNLHTIFELRARENAEVLLTDHLQMHFLRLGDMLKRRLEGLVDLSVGLQHWMLFFAFGAETSEDKMSQMVENNPAVMAAYEEYRRFTLDASMQDLAFRRRRFLEDQRIYTQFAREEGLALGKAEGKAEGQTEKMFEIAQNMKQRGYDAATIADLTGLSLEEIERLN